MCHVPDVLEEGEFAARVTTKHPCAVTGQDVVVVGVLWKDGGDRDPPDASGVVSDVMGVKFCGCFSNSGGEGVQRATEHVQKLRELEGAVEFDYIMLTVGEAYVLDRRVGALTPVEYCLQVARERNAQRQMFLDHRERGKDAKTSEERRAYQEKRIEDMGLKTEELGTKTVTPINHTPTNPLPATDPAHAVCELLCREDLPRVPAQESVVIGCVTNLQIDRDVALLVVFGAFGAARAEEEMQRQYKRLGGVVDVTTAGMYKWLPWPAEPFQHARHLETPFSPESAELWNSYHRKVAEEDLPRIEQFKRFYADMAVAKEQRVAYWAAARADRGLPDGAEHAAVVSATLEWARALEPEARDAELARVGCGLVWDPNAEGGGGVVQRVDDDDLVLKPVPSMDE